MGSLQAQEMAEMLDTRTAIQWHLRSNHYPPVPVAMVDPCIEAIGACNELDHDRLISLNGAGLWRGQESAPAWAIVEGHHLQAWIELDEEFDE